MNINTLLKSDSELNKVDKKAEGLIKIDEAAGLLRVLADFIRAGGKIT